MCAAFPLKKSFLPDTINRTKPCLVQRLFLEYWFFFSCHVQAIWPSFFSKKWFLDKTTNLIFSMWTHSALWRGRQCCVHLPVLTKVCLSVIPFTAKFTQDWQKQVFLGLPDTCAPASRSLQVNIRRRKSPGLRRRGWVRQTQPKLGVSLQSQLVWLYSTGIFLPASLITETLSRCWRVQLPGEAEEGHWWVLLEKTLYIYIYMYILKSLELFCLPQHWVIQLQAHGYAHKAFFRESR